MDIIKGINIEVYDWLKEKSLSHWSRSYLGLSIKSDILLNDMLSHLKGLLQSQEINKLSSYWSIFEPIL